MYNGMTTRSRCKFAARSQSARVHNRTSPTGNSKRVDPFAPTDSTANSLKACNGYLELTHRHPVLISPSPDETSIGEIAKRQRRPRQNLSDISELLGSPRTTPSDYHKLSIESSTKERQYGDAKNMLWPPFKTTTRSLGHPAQKGTSVHGDDPLCEAAFILLEMRSSPFSTSGDRSASLIRVLVDGTDRCHSDRDDRVAMKSGGLRLTQPEDHRELNSLHCFVRSHLLEVFFTPQSDELSSQCPSVGSHDARASSISNTRKSESGQVGLRCVYCAHLPRTDRVGCTMSSFYPKSLNDIYRTVCTWQRVHFRNCRHIPASVRETYRELKEQDRTRGKTKYWVTSARQMGLADVNEERGGVCFVNDQATA